jgi:hypothetical protein
MAAFLCRLGLVASALSVVVPASGEVLFHWRFDAGSGTVARDVSGNGLDGKVTAKWESGDAGTTLFFNGTAATQVTIDLPQEKRLGTGSWTFSAWIKPTRLGMPDSPEGQNTRRMFSYGSWPQAIITLNIGGNGTFGCFMSYRDVNNKRIDGAAASAPNALKVGQWAHVVMVCDRENKLLTPYVNGVRQGARELPANFAGDFSVYGNLSVGNGWQNYWGSMGQVVMARHAMSTREVIGLFREQGGQFGLTTDEALLQREREALEAAAEQKARDEAMAAFSERNEAATAALLAGEGERARELLSAVAQDSNLPAHYRSYAHLRLAQVLAASGDRDAARTEYAKIAAIDEYPFVHREEAREVGAELGRIERGLPARDPAARRTEIPVVDEFAAEVHVAPDGDDGGDGSAERPFRTLQRARDAVRALKAGGVNGAICVRVHPGEYPVTEVLTLTAEDSGRPGAPVVYRAEEMGKAVLYGGTRVTGFKPVSDPAILARLPEEGRGRVWQADLRAQGITDYGELRVRGGIGQPPAPPTLEVFVDGTPMTLARWPNKGFVGIRELIEPGSAKEGKPSVFGYIDDRHARWTQANDLWLLGYWHFLWADATIQVAKIDTEAKTITTAKPYNYGGRGMNNHQGIIYYAFNLLEEIDQPGEWYLDREAGVLYMYPPKDLSDATVEIGMHSGPMVTFDSVTHVRLEGLVFDLARYNGIQVSNSSDCLIAGCTVKRMAATGIIVSGGERFGVFGCDLHALGRRGIEMRGGERETLEPAGHFVENCRIYNFGRVDRTYTQAVTVGGVGNRLSHNLLYDCPTSVISLGGNDHLIEFNDVHSAVQESDDQGGIDMWGNPTFRGNIFRYNRFRNIGKTGTEHAAHGQAAIRFDDTISGQLVYGNILYRGSNGNFGAVQMNSGRDNIFDNNMFLDNRYAISGGWSPGNAHWKQTEEGKKAGAYMTPLYLERYPAIAHMFDKNGQNVFWRNIFWRCGTLVRRPQHIEMFENAIFEADEDPGFVDLAGGDFRLRADSEVFSRIAFRPIPVNEIGLYAHPLRASWPVETTPVEKADWRIGFKKEQAASGVMPHALAIHPVTVPRVKKAPELDGAVDSEEWPVKTVLLKDTPSRKPAGGKPVEAWLMHDGTSLYVALRVPVDVSADRLAAARDEWGRIDGAEVCLRETGVTAAGKRAPTLILQGFPNGDLIGATDPEEFSMREAKALAGLSRFAAGVGDGFWVGEWAIPIPGMGLAYTPGLRLQFNIGVHRTKPDDWVALAGALGANYKLDNAAVIVLE